MPNSANILASDGSVASDLPMVRLSELFNVNHFIVSQVCLHPPCKDALYSHE